MFKVGDKILVYWTNFDWKHIYPVGVQTISEVNIKSRFMTTKNNADYCFDQELNDVSKFVPASNLALLLWGEND